MPFIPGRSPNPSYFRGIPGAKDGDSRGPVGGAKTKDASAPSTSWRSNDESAKSWKPETVNITPAEAQKRQKNLDAQRAKVEAEERRRAGGSPDPSDKPSLRDFSRAQLTGARPTNHQEANNLLEVMAEKGRDGMLKPAELKTITDCVNVVKKSKADPYDAQLALKNLLGTQNPTTTGAETLKKLISSLG